MRSTASEIRMIPISAITVLNPRVRNKKIFNELVTSIAHLGLKKPITVSERSDQSGYDLVCGQGRLEAFTAQHGDGLIRHEAIGSPAIRDDRAVARQRGKRLCQVLRRH